MSEGFTANLISLRALLLEGYSVMFRLKYAVMTTPSGERIFLQVDNEGMWVFPWEIGVKNKSQPLFRLQDDVLKSDLNATAYAITADREQTIQFGLDENFPPQPEDMASVALERVKRRDSIC